MLKLEYLQELLLVSITLSTITCTFIQKTKVLFKTSKYLMIYSLFINIIFSILFSYSFTTILFPTSLWIGLFSFLGADSIYKTLEGKIPSHKEITNK